MRRAPALHIDRDAHDLVHGQRRLGLLRRAAAQVREDLLDGHLVVEVGHDLELPPALATCERVGMEDLRDEARPARTTAALLGGLPFNLVLSRLLRGAISAHSMGIVAVEERAVSPRVRDVIRHPREGGSMRERDSSASMLGLRRGAALTMAAPTLPLLRADHVGPGMWYDYDAMRG